MRKNAGLPKGPSTGSFLYCSGPVQESKSLDGEHVPQADLSLECCSIEME